MNADAAFKKSKFNLIESELSNGLAVIFQKPESSEKFYLCFVPRIKSKNYDFTATIAVGLYDDLDTAVTIACIGYGAYDSKWKPGVDYRNVAYSTLDTTLKYTS